MSADQVSVVGNLGDDPDLRYSPVGTAFTRFSVAQTARKKDGDKWVDGDTFWWRCTAFGTLAENVAESLSKGDRVIVVGRLEPDNYETKDGEKRSTVGIVADSVGPELRWASATVHKAERHDGPEGPTARKSKDMADEWDRKAKDDDAPF